MTVRYARHPDLRMTALEGEGVVLHLGTRRYFSVNETGLTILQAMEAPRTVDELAAALVEHFEVTPDAAEQSVREFVDRCCRSDLLVREDGG